MEFGTFEEAYAGLERGVEHFRLRFGDAKSNQLLDMLRQARLHINACDGLGLRLLQDVESVIINRAPFAYPKRLYRWPRPQETPDPDLVPLSDVHGELFQEIDRILETQHEYPGHDFSPDRRKFCESIRMRRNVLGDDLTDQFLDMMSQVETDFSNVKAGLGNGLMVDISRILCGLSVPWHYPRELYRWPASRNLRPKRRVKKD